MTSVLEEILRYTRKRVEIEKNILKALPDRTHAVNDLYGRLLEHARRGVLGIISEYKRASPRGVINLSLSVEEFYEKTRNMSAAYSVLTEPRWFLGSYLFLRELRELDRTTPILMKDFVVDTWQIDLAYSLGADAVLLIVKVLGERELERYVEKARSLGLNVILEVDSMRDAEAIARCYDSTPGVILGVNSRDLTTLQVDLPRACNIVKNLEFRGPIIVESGVKSREDVLLIRRTGRASGVLVGTSIMRNIDLLRDLHEAATR